MAAPPGDYLMSARDYFKEYIKPILVASMVDWEVVDGRKEGDVRYKIAEITRETRRRAGEKREGAPQEPDIDDIIADMRKRGGISNPSERGGDLIIGRHTWKEYIRGIHEGWLGPLDSPQSALVDTASEGSDAAGLEDKDTSGRPSDISDLAGNTLKQSPTVQAAITGAAVPAASTPETSDSVSEGTDDASPTADADTKTEAEKEVEKKPEPDLTLPYIRPNAYPASSLSPSIPDTFAPAVGVGFPHLLGFLNTPIRVWRFLNRRHIAETTGATVAAFILAPEEDVRSFDDGTAMSADTMAEEDSEDGQQSEVQRVLRHEERDWHKSARKPNKEGEEDKERPWQEDMITSSNIISRMRTIDVKSFNSRTRLNTSDHMGPTDLAGAAVASAAGSVLAGSSGGDDGNEVDVAREGPRDIGWKGGANRMDLKSWTDMFKEMVGMQSDKRPKPWQQGFEGDEEP